MKVMYQGNEISLHRLAKLTKIARTTIYRSYHNGNLTSEAILADIENRKDNSKYASKRITLTKTCREAGVCVHTTQRRLKGGLSLEDALDSSKDYRGRHIESKLTPSDVITIYTTLFYKEKTQKLLAQEYGLAQGNISKIWTHQSWGWLTAPLRYKLENE